jgi:hypothetical protein
VKVTIQYVEGCPHWKAADHRVRNVLSGIAGNHVDFEYQLIDSPETAERAGFHGSPTILIDGLDPFAGEMECGS